MKSPHRDPILLTAAVVLLFGALTVGRAFAGKSNGGAVFTTNAGGTATNMNSYASKGDVFLNGGPQNANCAAAGLSDGAYVFQVTDPAGKTLLSSDDVVQRRFSVSSGVISSYLGSTHAISAGPCGGRTIGLAPFNSSTNGGGEYKVWVTAAENYSPSKGVFGFMNSDSKTDNFKIAASVGGNGGKFLGRAYQDLNTNGTDDSEPGMASATIVLKTIDTAASVATVIADAGGYYAMAGIAAGTYDLCEVRPAGWYFTEPQGTNGCARLTIADGATMAQNFGNAPENID